MASERAVPSDLFPLVLAFLRENHFDGAARAFGKAAGVTEQDPNAASLLDIFNYWLNEYNDVAPTVASYMAVEGCRTWGKITAQSPIAKKQQAFANGVKKTKKKSSRYESSSENEIPPVKKQATKPVTVPPVPIKSTSGSSESSSSDNTDSTDSEQEGEKTAKKGIILQSTIQKTKSQKTSKDSSSDSSSSEDETPKHQPPKSKGAQKVIKLASTSAKPTKVMSKTTNGKAESSSSSDDTSSSEESSSEENQPVKGKLKKLPHCKNITAQPLPVKTKQVKKSNSETSCDSSEHEKLASKPKRGEYSAVPPPLAIESRKGKAHPIKKKTFKKNGENNEKKEQVFTKRPSTEGSMIKKGFAPKSLPVSIQKGNTSSGSDSDSSSEEEKKVLVKCSAKAVSANGAVPFKKVSSSSDTSDSDSSDSVPEKFAVRTGIKKVKKPLGVLAKKVESSLENKKVHKIKGTEAVKTTFKSSTPISKPKSSESSSSSSSSSEEETQPSQKEAGKLSVGSSLIVSKQTPAEIRTSSENSTDKFKISEKTEKKRGQNNCKTAKKVLKTSANLVGKTSALKTPTSEVLNSANSSSSDEEATKEGLSPKKRKRKDEQELETPDIKKMKARSPHTFPKSKRQSSPFRRIRTEEIEIDVRVANNSFDAKRGAIGDWGEKANDVLKFTKGKSFRHEKTKKKRGSYCGGTISTQINSIKFESD